MTDRQIIELFLQRDESALQEVTRLYGRRLTRIAEQLLSKEDAEECVNDLYLTMWNHIPPDEPERLFAYMSVILKNISREKLSANKAAKRNAELVELSDELAACIPDPNANTEEEAVFRVSNTLNEFLNKQSRANREIFVLRYWYGQSIKEIAKHSGFSQAKTEKTLFRMKQRLHNDLTE